MKRNYIVALLLMLAFVGYFHEYLFMGKDAHVRVHDNMDSDVIFRHHLAEEGLIFAGPLASVRPIMNGLPRVCLPSGLNIMVWLFGIFGTFWGFVLSEFLVHTLAYVGAYYLLANHFLKEEKYFWLRHLAALLFATMSFFPVTGGAVALQPLLLNAFLNIRNSGKIRLKDVLQIVIFPFYSGFAWVGLFVLLFLSGFALYNLFSQGLRKSWPFIAGIAILTVCAVIADYQLFMAFLMPEKLFVSHRVNFQVETNYNIKGVMAMGVWNAAMGIYHSAVYAGLVFFLAPLILLVEKLRRRDSIFGDKQVFVLGAIYLGIGLLTTIWFWDKLAFLYAPGSLLTQINFSRFHYLLPLSGFVLGIYALSKMQENWSRYAVAGMMLVGIGWQYHLYREMHHYPPGEDRHNHHQANMSFNDYYSPAVFGPLKESCDALAQTKDYNILCLGIQPAVLQYNGFNTLDSYQNFYPLKYEQDFLKIMAPELAKCPEIKEKASFKIHNECYLLSCEMLHQVKAVDHNTLDVIQELLLDPDAIQALNGRFIVSKFRVLNFGTARIKEVKHLQGLPARDYQEIYLYEVL